MTELLPEARQIYCDALDTFGPEAQTLMLFEEAAELQKELCKNSRGKDNREAIAEEIADVEIMLAQMKLLHKCEGAVAQQTIRKTIRLKERIQEHKALVTTEGEE